MADNGLKYFQSVKEIRDSMTSPVEVPINLDKNYLYIDSPVAFYLISNDGRDISYFPIGGWTFDCYKLLPKKYRELNPVFTMSILFDSALLGESQDVIINTTDVAFFDSATSLFGQSVTDTKAVEALAENRVQSTQDIKQQTEAISQDISQQSVDIADSISTNVDSLKTGLTQQTTDIETAIKVISDTLGSDFRSFLEGYLQGNNTGLSGIQSRQDVLKGVIGANIGSDTMMTFLDGIKKQVIAIGSIVDSLLSRSSFSAVNVADIPDGYYWDFELVVSSPPLAFVVNKGNVYHGSGTFNDMNLVGSPLLFSFESGVGTLFYFSSSNSRNVVMLNNIESIFISASRWCPF